MNVSLSKPWINDKLRTIFSNSFDLSFETYLKELSIIEFSFFNNNSSIRTIVPLICLPSLRWGLHDCKTFCN